MLQLKPENKRNEENVCVREKNLDQIRKLIAIYFIDVIKVMVSLK